MSTHRETRVTLVGSRAGIGGTERHLASLVRGLPRRGFEVELVLSEGGALTEIAAASGVRVVCLERHSRSAYFRKLAGHLRRTRPNVVHAHTGRLPCLAARVAGVPLVLDTRHGNLDLRLDPNEDVRPEGAEFQPGLSERAAWRIEGAKTALSDLTLLVCERDRTNLVRFGGVAREKTRVVLNGISLDGARTGGRLSNDAFTEPGSTDGASSHGAPVEGTGPAQSDAPLVIGWLGRMAEQKAPERVIELFAWLVGVSDSGEPSLPSRVGERLRLAMYGDGPLRPELESLAARLGVAERVSFPGPTNDVLGALGGLGLFLLPSRKEGLPYVLLEAMAAGGPTLSTPVGGIAEVLTGDLAEGVVPWRLDAWGAVAVRWLVDPAHRERLRSASRERVRGFDEDDMVNEIAAIYREGSGA
ncbi:MAG: glycosyltransferase [Candidatus Eisenbacteria bacterium]|nr:glycosyltransferase [Candidatus Eisenbacteria bacterium]